MYSRILVANRSDCALEIIEAIQGLGAKAVLCTAYEDRRSVAAERADDVIVAGNAKSAYMDADAVLQAAVQSRCQAIHPGFGFLSEDPYVAARARLAHIAYIAPPSDCLELFNHKRRSKELAKRHGITTIPTLTVEALQSGDFPLVIKTDASGGGKGVAQCANMQALTANYLRLSGLGSVFCEPIIDNARHLECQLIADCRGNVRALGWRDCSVQVRHQKRIEYRAEARADVEDLLCGMLRDIGYVGTGTAEFLCTVEGAIYFMEFNPRLQLEHLVSDMSHGCDLVRDSILLAYGYALDEISVCDRDLFAVEARLYAENSSNFEPDFGKISDIYFPEEENTRVVCGYRAGDALSPAFDNMIARVCVARSDAGTAFSDLRRVLGGIRIEGVNSNISYLREQLLSLRKNIDSDTLPAREK